MNIEQAYALIWAELVAAEKKHPEWPTDLIHADGIAPRWAKTWTGILSA